MKLAIIFISIAATTFLLAEGKYLLVQVEDPEGKLFLFTHPNYFKFISSLTRIIDILFTYRDLLILTEIGSLKEDKTNVGIPQISILGKVIFKYFNIHIILLIVF